MTFAFRLAIACIAVVLPVGAARAACDFDRPHSPSHFDSTMVRSFRICADSGTPSGPPPPDTFSVGMVPACSDPSHSPVSYYDSAYRFADSGRSGCRLRLAAEVEDDCSTLADAGGSSLGLPAGPCQVTRVRSKCQGIVTSDGITPIGATDSGWSLALLLRITTDDPVGGAMTLVDLPLTLEFPPPANGKIAIDENLQTALLAIGGAAQAALSPCTSLEVVVGTIRDPDSTYFARVGVGS